MSLRREMPEGGRFLSKWYGVAWDEWRGEGPVTVVCYPIPLNAIFGLAHAIWLRLRGGWPLRGWRASYLCRNCRRPEERP